MLVVSDGVAFNAKISSPKPNECIFDAGRSLEIANKLRKSGATVSSLGVFSLGYTLEDEKSAGGDDDLWLAFSLYGRKFLGALAGVNNESVPCSLEDGIQSSENNQEEEKNQGKYLEPMSAHEFATFIDEITSQDTFLKNLPRRVS